MRILSIETSCDETALAIIEADGNSKNFTYKTIDTALYSQIEVHKQYGGVFPAIAKREHAKNLIPLLESLKKSLGEKVIQNSENKIEKTNPEIKNILEREYELFESLQTYLKNNPSIPNIDLIAVTAGPGLEPALWVGINFARALSLAWQIPMLPINHMEGHIVSVLKEYDSDSTENSKKEERKIEFPAVALLISGGHTELIEVKKFGEYNLIGQTKDDAVGEAFDKVARILGLPYPGGPEISKLSEKFRLEQKNYSSKDGASADTENTKTEFTLPRPMINSGDLNFSFSGLKTAVLYLVKKIKEKSGEELDEIKKSTIANEFENAVTEVLIKKTETALNQVSAKSLIIGGGVIANNHIRNSFIDKLGQKWHILLPPKSLATDNAVMIGIAGFLKQFYDKPEISPEIKAYGNMPL